LYSSVTKSLLVKRACTPHFTHCCSRTQPEPSHCTLVTLLGAPSPALLLSPSASPISFEGKMLRCVRNRLRWRYVTPMCAPLSPICCIGVAAAGRPQLEPRPPVGAVSRAWALDHDPSPHTNLADLPLGMGTWVVPPGGPNNTVSRSANPSSFFFCMGTHWGVHYLEARVEDVGLQGLCLRCRSSRPPARGRSATYVWGL
jgi:hypothetical protein